MKTLKDFGFKKVKEGVLSFRLQTLNGLSGAAKTSLAEKPVTEVDSYLQVPFRGLSSIIIPDYFVDFSKDGVLEKAVPLFNGKTMYKDHHTVVDNWIGKVQNAKWSAADGEVPAGVDFDAMIYNGEDLTGTDEIQRKLVIGLRERILFACSATVFFKWEKSHQDLEESKFWSMLGREVDDNIVRLVVTEIVDVGEMSIVWLGADPYATRKDGFSKIQFSSEFTGKYGENAIDIENTILEFEKAKTELSGYKEDILSTINKEVKLLKEDFMLGESFQQFLKTQSIAALQSFAGKYHQKLEKELPLQCAKCGSRSIERRSSLVNAEQTTKTVIDYSKIP